jgi:hypothetical protein
VSAHSPPRSVLFVSIKVAVKFAVMVMGMKRRPLVLIVPHSVGNAFMKVTEEQCVMNAKKDVRIAPWYQLRT